MRRLFAQTIGARFGLPELADPDDFDLMDFFGEAFDPAPPVDVRKPDRLVCPTCMRVHLPVEGSERVDMPEELREEGIAREGGDDGEQSGGNEEQEGTDEEGSAPTIAFPRGENGGPEGGNGEAAEEENAPRFALEEASDRSSHSGSFHTVPEDANDDEDEEDDDDDDGASGRNSPDADSLDSMPPLEPRSPDAESLDSMPHLEPTASGLTWREQVARAERNSRRNEGHAARTLDNASDAERNAPLEPHGEWTADAIAHWRMSHRATANAAETNAPERNTPRNEGNSSRTVDDVFDAETASLPAEDGGEDANGDDDALSVPSSLPPLVPYVSDAVRVSRARDFRRPISSEDERRQIQRAVEASLRDQRGGPGGGAAPSEGAEAPPEEPPQEGAESDRRPAGRTLPPEIDRAIDEAVESMGRLAFRQAMQRHGAARREAREPGHRHRRPRLGDAGEGAEELEGDMPSLASAQEDGSMPSLESVPGPAAPEEPDGEVVELAELNDGSSDDSSMPPLEAVEGRGTAANRPDPVVDAADDDEMSALSAGTAGRGEVPYVPRGPYIPQAAQDLAREAGVLRVVQRGRAAAANGEAGDGGSHASSLSPASVPSDVPSLESIPSSDTNGNDANNANRDNNGANNNDANNANDNDDNSRSTHSSMPALIRRDDLSESSLSVPSSLPPLVPLDAPRPPTRPNPEAAGAFRRFMLRQMEESRARRREREQNGGSNNGASGNNGNNGPTNPLTHLRDYGALRVFARATCPVCLEATEPTVALPCGHCVCEADFGRLGGYLAADLEKLRARAGSQSAEAEASSTPARSTSARGVAASAPSAGQVVRLPAAAARRAAAAAHASAASASEAAAEARAAAASARVVAAEARATSASRPTAGRTASAFGTPHQIAVANASHRQSPVVAQRSTTAGVPSQATEGDTPSLASNAHSSDSSSSERGAAWAWSVARHCTSPECNLSGEIHRSLYSLCPDDGVTYEACYPSGSRAVPDGRGGLWIHKARYQNGRRARTDWPLVHRTPEGEEEEKFAVPYHTACMVSDGLGGVVTLQKANPNTGDELRVVCYSPNHEAVRAALVPSGSTLLYAGDGKVWVNVNSSGIAARIQGLMDDGLYIFNATANRYVHANRFSERICPPEGGEGRVSPDGRGGLWRLGGMVEDDGTISLALKHYSPDGTCVDTGFEFRGARQTSVHGCDSADGVFVFDQSEDENGEVWHVSEDEDGWSKVQVGESPAEPKFVSDGEGGLWALTSDDDGEEVKIWRCDEDEGMQEVGDWNHSFGSTELIAG